MIRIQREYRDTERTRYLNTQIEESRRNKREKYV